MLDILKGKKTYLVAVTTFALALADAMGWAVPASVYAILGALGLTTVRQAIG